MCGLFGFVNYSGKEIHNLDSLTNVLAKESAVRGTDAVGIAYSEKEKMNIIKEGKSAYAVEFKHPSGIKALIGHTRHSTQGNGKKNFNNHPFYGNAGKCRFALAHNGVIINDVNLRKELNLPKTKVQTDSFIAVQLLEYKKKLNFSSLKFMAEKISGSFSFTVLDNYNNLYIVKGDSPVSIIHFPSLKLYVYASTEEILWSALIKSDLFNKLKNKEYKTVTIDGGQIIKIDTRGTIQKSTFDVCNYSFMEYCDWWEYPKNDCEMTDGENEYLENLKIISYHYGYTPEMIDHLVKEGFTPEEIEEYMYCCCGEGEAY